MQVTDLIHYNHMVRRLYFDALTKLPWTTVTEPRGLSFDSMRNVFLHLTLVEDRWVNYVIPGRFKEWVDPDFDSYTNMSQIGGYLQRVENSTEVYLAKLDAVELNRQITIRWSTYPEARIPVEKVLTHMVLEDMIHHGELSAALWQLGEEAPYVGFWRYNPEKSNLK